MNENYESSVDRVKQLTDGVERLIINLKMKNSGNNMKRCKISFSLMGEHKRKGTIDVKKI
jgi:hypothetical protein